MNEKELMDRQSELSRIKTEIAELNQMKGNLVRDINIKLLEANKQAEVIIANAETQAKAVNETSTKRKEEIDAYVTEQRKGIDSLLHITKQATEELRDAQDKLKQAQADFETLKAKQAEEVKDAITSAQNIEKAYRGQQAQADILVAELNQKINELKVKTDELSRSSELLRTTQATLDADRKELNAKIDACTKDRELIEMQRIENERVSAEIKIAQEKIVRDAQVNTDNMNANLAQAKEIAEQRKSIAAQFSIIEKNQKEQEEKELALNEREELIAIKDREVEQKIRILQELRAKK
jgi:hypothetical protein